MDQLHQAAQLRLRASDLTDLAGLAGGSWLYVAGETLAHPPSQHSGPKRKGNVYVRHQGESIRDVLIIPDTVTEVSGGETAGQHTADTGVVFDLSASASAVAVAEGQPGFSLRHSDPIEARWAADDLAMKVRVSRDNGSAAR